MLGTTNAPRLLGYVQLRVGDRVVAVPVQAMKLDQDGDSRPGGFYVTGKEYGIYVDAAGEPHEVADQIRAATHEAARHIGARFAN